MLCNPAIKIMGSKQIVRPTTESRDLDVVLTPDGGETSNRPPYPRNPANPEPNSSAPVISKDVTLDQTKNTWLRLYLPRDTIHSTASSPKKLPLMVYFHGGGFVCDHADSSIYDVFCRGLVEIVGAMVISLEYRLAPEHRLPAAYEDGMDGLYWMKNTKDDWVTNYADLGDCYLCGTSAGGNLAYHTGLRAAVVFEDLEPLRIKGLVLHHPAFSGNKRTASEERLATDSVLSLYVIDQAFTLALPEGVDHDHEYCNPFVNGGSKDIDKMKDLGWRVLVALCNEDPLVDAGMECANMLEAKGLETVRFYREGYHAMEVFDPAMSAPLYAAIKGFIYQH